MLGQLGLGFGPLTLTAQQLRNVTPLSSYNRSVNLGPAQGGLLL